MSTAIRASAAMALTEVPPLTVPTVKVVLGSDGGLQLGDLRDRPAHGVDRARQAEFLERVAAGALEDHLVAMAAGRLVDDAADAEPVDRDEAVDVAVVAKQRLHAAQIAEFLLADGADEHHVADGHELVFVHRLDQRQQRGQPARIVADAGRRERRPFP